MTATLDVAAVDLGAESGRVVVASFDGQRVSQREVHRFPNAARAVAGELRWPMERITAEVARGLTAAITGGAIAAVGVDSWGLDYGLYDAAGNLLADPRCYRDPVSRGMADELTAACGAERLYARTGARPADWMAFAQLVAESRTPAGRARQAGAAAMVHIADVVHEQLCGVLASERTLATTSGCYDVTRGEWATDLLAALGVPPEIVLPTTEPGSVLGTLAPGFGQSGTVQVITPASHDTASAVTATPLGGPGSAFISSGTWSLIGVEVGSPDTSPAALAAGVVNEGGFGAQRLLRNLTGLWLVQECRRQWQREGSSYSFAELTRLASAAEPFRTVIDPSDVVFVEPGDMPARIRQFCRRTGQPEPRDVGEVVRCALESLAMTYGRTLSVIAGLTGRTLTTLHIVGGGSRIDLLNQLAADATGLTVHAGPVEATALGNALVQLHALGEIHGLAQLRAVAARSEHPRTFLPQTSAAFQAATARFAGLQTRAGAG